MMGSDSDNNLSRFHPLTLSPDSDSDPLAPADVTPGDSDPLLNPQPSDPKSPSYAVAFSPFNPRNAGPTPTPADADADADYVTFSPFNPRNAGPTPTPVDADADYVTITVSDPHKEQESASNSLVPGSGSHITYLVSSRSPHGAFSVRRRFRDFVILSDRLAESYRGFFIPPRPDKSVVESQVMQKQEFVENRRVQLEKYLCRLAGHPVISRSDELAAFLRAPGRVPLPGTIDVASRVLDGAVRLPGQLFGEGAVGRVSPQDAVQPAKGGRDLLRMFKELKQSVANDWGGVKPAVVEEDKEFLERKGKVQELEQQLTLASQQAESLIKAQQDTGEVMGELGLAFIKLAKFETEESIYDSQRLRAGAMKQFATASVKASRLYRESNSQTVKHLGTLHEYLGLMLAVQNAFSDRSSALLTVQTLLSDLSSLHLREEKLEAASSRTFGGDNSRIRKVEDLKASIRITEDAKSCALREYERIKENNRSELERFDKERHNNFLRMLKGFVINQVGYAEKIASVWTKVEEETRGFATEQLN